MRRLAAGLDVKLRSTMSRVMMVKNHTGSLDINADRLEYFARLSAELSGRIEECKRGKPLDILNKVNRKQALMEIIFQEVSNSLKEGDATQNLERGEQRLREVGDAIMAMLDDSPKERTDTGARILSLCGDGVLVLSQLLILQELMLKVGRFEDLSHAALPCKYFDLIVGTGTGALAAIFLGRLEMTAQEAISAFCRITRETAANPPSLNPDNLASRMRDIVQEQLGTPFAPMGNPSGCRTLVFAVTHSLVDAPPIPFRSYNTDRALASVFSIIQVATAVCAPLDRPARLGSPPVSYTNAAPFLYNDPTELALEETEHLWTSSYGMVVLCIGPGTRTVVDASGGKKKQEAAYKNLAAGSRDTVHESVYRKSKGEFIYRRLQVNRGLEHIRTNHWGMDEKIMETITDITHGYLRFKETEDDMSIFASTLCNRQIHGNISETVPRIDHESLNQTHLGREDGLGLEQQELEIDRHFANPAPDFSLFTRKDIVLTKTIKTLDFQPWVKGSDYVAVTLHEAKQPGNCRKLLVKTFEGQDRNLVLKEFLGQLATYRKTWNPTLLQIEGWNDLGADIPIQVYHAPEDIDEGFLTWLPHTLLSNPKDAIFGLYDMRNSINALYQFGKRHRVHLGLIFTQSVVTVQQDGDRPQYSLVFTGQLRRGQFPSDHPLAENLNPSYQYMVPIFFQSSLNRKDSHYDLLFWAARIIAAFASRAENWLDDMQDLESRIKKKYEEIDFLQLESVLMDANLLETYFDDVPLPTALRLGDVGFMRSNDWVVVTNLHGKLSSVDGYAPRWGMKESGKHVFTDHYGEIFIKSGEKFRRYEHTWKDDEAMKIPVHPYFLQYIDLDERHARKTLQHEICCIAKDHGLPVAPHQLQLVTSISHLLAHKVRISDSFPGYTSAHSPIVSHFYEFHQDAVINVDDSGVPELHTCMFYSWEPNIAEVDCETHYETSKTKGGLTLTQKHRKRAAFLQLPKGFSIPHHVGEI